MWAALPCWILANIFYSSVIRHGSFFLAIVGGLKVLTCIIWSVVKNPLPLRIPFEDGTIVMKPGANFHLTLIGGK